MAEMVDIVSSKLIYLEEAVYSHLKMLINHFLLVQQVSSAFSGEEWNRKVQFLICANYINSAFCISIALNSEFSLMSIAYLFKSLLIK